MTRPLLALLLAALPACLCLAAGYALGRAGAPGPCVRPVNVRVTVFADTEQQGRRVMAGLLPALKGLGVKR